jgi:hypothetical protein
MPQPDHTLIASFFLLSEQVGILLARFMTFSMAFPTLKQSALLWLVLLLADMIRLVYSIPTIHVSGQKLFTSDGHQFFVKGLLSRV